MNENRLGDAEGIIQLLTVRADHYDACAFGYMQEDDERREADYRLRAKVLHDVVAELEAAMRPEPPVRSVTAQVDQRCVFITEMTGTLTAAIIDADEWKSTFERYEQRHATLIGPHTKWESPFVHVPPAAPRRDGSIPRLDIRYVFIEAVDDMPMTATIHATEAEALRRAKEFREEYADEFERNAVFLGLHAILIPPARPRAQA